MSYSILNKYQIHPIFLEIEQILNEELNIILDLAVKDNFKNISESEKENDVNFFIEQYISPVIEIGRYNILPDKFKIVSLPMFEIISIINDSKKSKLIKEKLARLFSISLGENLVPPKDRYKTVVEGKNILEEYGYENIFPNIKDLITFISDFNSFSEKVESPFIGDFLKFKTETNEENFEYFSRTVDKYIYAHQEKNKELPNSLFEVSLLLTSMILFSNKIMNEDVKFNNLQKNNIAEYAEKCIELIDEHFIDHDNRIRMIWKDIIFKLKK